MRHKLGIAIAAQIAAYSVAAQAQADWTGFGPTSTDLRSFGQVDCATLGYPNGNETGYCTCINKGYSGGSCTTIPNTATPYMVSPQTSTSRFQIVQASAPHRGNSLGVLLHHYDWTPDLPSSATNTNHLVYSQDLGVNTFYDGTDDNNGHNLRDRYFGWSMRFPSAAYGNFPGQGDWTSWSCIANHQGEFGYGQPSTYCDPFEFATNVFEFHHFSNDDSVACGSTPTNFLALRSNFSAGAMSGTYDLVFRTLEREGLSTDPGPGSPPIYELHRWSPLRTDTWYDFILHIHFADTRTAGFYELWQGNDQGQINKMMLMNCPTDNSADRTICKMQTLFDWPNPNDSFVQANNCNIHGKMGAMSNYLMVGLYAPLVAINGGLYDINYNPRATEYWGLRDSTRITGVSCPFNLGISVGLPRSRGTIQLSDDGTPNGTGVRLASTYESMNGYDSLDQVTFSLLNVPPEITASLDRTTTLVGQGVTLTASSTTDGTYSFTIDAHSQSLVNPAETCDPGYPGSSTHFTKNVTVVVSPPSGGGGGCGPGLVQCCDLSCGPPASCSHIIC
jgi:hypothetical protein